ncbi:VWA domain-containing protein [Verrucomicrobiota bacterium]
MFRFSNPYYFFLIIPLGIAAWFVYRRKTQAGLLFAPASRIPVGKGTWRIYTANVLPSMFLAGLSLLVVALARPQTIFSKSRRFADVIAIEMVVDVSGSMNALDFSTKTRTDTKFRSRLDVVKDTFAEFVEKRTDDMIGIITFGGYATTRAPLTSDYNALLHVLNGIKVPEPVYDKSGRVLNQEELLTAIGDALATACARLEHTEPKSKIIVLLSDGESNTGIIKPEQAINAAEKLGIKVYTIGVGSTGRAPFWGKDFFGRKDIYYSNVSLDEELLKEIANKTNGRYFNVRNPQGLEDAMEEIDKLEKTRIEREEYHQYNELFTFFLWPGLALTILGICLNMMIVRRIV